MIHIDYTDKRPIYEQITNRFETLILNGVLEKDEKIPAVRALAVELSINPNTIQRAYAQLEREGYIYSVKGRGNFVKAGEDLFQKKRQQQLKELEIQLRHCKEQGIEREEIISKLNQVFKEDMT